jgi:hypothetical protein
LKSYNFFIIFSTRPIFFFYLFRFPVFIFSALSLVIKASPQVLLKLTPELLFREISTVMDQSKLY